MTFIAQMALASIARARIRLQFCLGRVPWEACGDRMLRLL